MKQLLQAGAAVGLTDKNGCTVLYHLALEHDAPDAAALLLDHGGAAPGVLDARETKGGYTALGLAVVYAR